MPNSQDLVTHMIDPSKAANWSATMSDNGLLDPDTVKIMDEAFGLAWRFLRTDPVLGEIDQAILRKALARALLVSVRTGERNAHRLADGAIAVVRQAAIASMVH